MTAGPKAAPLHLPLDLEGLPQSGGARVVAFLERYVRTTKGKGARTPSGGGIRGLLSLIAETMRASGQGHFARIVLAIRTKSVRAGSPL
jgi:hypothetical protein